MENAQNDFKAKALKWEFYSICWNGITFLQSFSLNFQNITKRIVSLTNTCDDMITFKIVIHPALNQIQLLTEYEVFKDV